ncbi:MAG: hypothetical protein U7126_28835 [Microcoleus sp.]
MSDWKDDYNLLGLGGLTSLITNVKVSLWGKEVLIECVYSPEERLPYVLGFKDCREISWTVQDEDEVSELEAEFLGIYLGEPKHHKPAVITTDIFEISILYGSFSIHKGQNISSEIADLETTNAAAIANNAAVTESLKNTAEIAGLTPPLSMIEIR